MAAKKKVATKTKTVKGNAPRTARKPAAKKTARKPAAKKTAE